MLYEFSFHSYIHSFDRHINLHTCVRVKLVHFFIHSPPFLSMLLIAFFFANILIHIKEHVYSDSKYVDSCTWQTRESLRSLIGNNVHEGF